MTIEQRLCPHGLPLADNTCGPCSEGRPMTHPREVVQDDYDNPRDARMVGDARELDDQRQELVAALGEWRNAETPNENLCDAIEAFVEAKVDHMSNFPPRQRMTDKGSLEMPTGTCPGTTRGNLGANSPVQRLPDLVQRFLGWPLPASVCSDLCVTDSKYQFPRSGTNLLTAEEARQMLEYVLKDYMAHMQELEELVTQFNDGHTPPEES